jgi:hypothetical protein
MGNSDSNETEKEELNKFHHGDEDHIEEMM